MTSGPALSHSKRAARRTTSLLAIALCCVTAISGSAIASTFNGLTAGTSFIVGKRARVVATGDFNGDGIPDIAIAGLGSNQLNVMLSCAPGAARCVNGYLPAVNYAVGTPMAVVAADVNGDGILDLLVASAGGNSVSLFLGHADGTFTTSKCAVSGGLCATGLDPTALAVGNFTGKAKEVDLVIVNTAANTVSVLLGNGTTFNAPRAYNVGVNPTAVAIADVNGDNFPDIVVTNGGSNTVTVMLGNGAGSFTLKSSPATGLTPVSIAIADFNSDHVPDLVVANSVGNSVNLLIGNGDGTYQPATNINAGANPQSVAVGDFNGDGQNDLVVANGSGNNITVLLGLGNGSFQPGVEYSTGAKTVASMVVTDLNGDHNQDIVVTNADLVPGQVTLLFGNGDGTFKSGRNYPVGVNPMGIVTGDFNCDTKQDIAVANSGSNNVQLLMGNGDATFTSGSILTTDTNPVAVISADFNQDGVPDLATVNSVSGDVTVFLGIAGCAGFSAGVNYTLGTSLGTSVNPVSLAAADFNGDGYPDIVVANAGTVAGNGNLLTLINNKTGGFGTPIPSYIGSNPGFVASGDFNGDNKQDVAVTDLRGGSVSVLLGNGAGSFTLKSTNCVGTTACAGVPQAIAVGNFNGDTHPDIAVANYDDVNVTILIGKGNGTFGVAKVFSVGANPMSLVAAPMQGNNTQQDLVVANSENDTVSVLLNQLNNSGAFKGGTVNLFAAGESPAAIGIADFDNDGKLDVAVANQSSNNVTIMRQK